jgi:hypothetical protein
VRRSAGNPPAVRAIFVVYLTLIVAGIAFYTVVGLTQH